MSVQQHHTKSIRRGKGEMKQPSTLNKTDSTFELVQFVIPKTHQTHAFSDVDGVLVGGLATKNVTPPWLSTSATVTIVIG